jgi:cell division protein FtsW (lipid II flippase)
VISSQVVRRYRFTEAVLLLLTALTALIGFVLLAITLQVRQDIQTLISLPQMILLATMLVAGLIWVHLLLSIRRVGMEQILWPIVCLFLVLGTLLIWRLRGAEGAWQQILRGLLPGLLLITFFILRPTWVEYLRHWAVPISLIGLALPIATAIFGEADETGVRLALKIGPLPAIQTSEFVKLSLIIFLAWYIEKQGEKVEGRAVPVLDWLRMPSLSYFIPGTLFVILATLALVGMSDFGAVLVLGVLFVAMLYAGFETRIFTTVVAIGLALAVLVGLVLYFTWKVPVVIQYRILAFLDPWSQEMIMIDGQPAGITVSQGPGYQIQQAIYAVAAGGISGTGLGFGSPEYIPLAHSDFIYAALLEEFGSIIGIAVLILFAVLLLRILRLALLLPQGQVFERLLCIGIGFHLFAQVFIMVGGTLNLIPLTGLTVPFLSQGGAALLVYLLEVGILLALVQRLDRGSA